MTFNFEYGFDCIEKALQEVKTKIFRILQNPLDLIQPDWNTEMSHALECDVGLTSLYPQYACRPMHKSFSQE